ncbi:HAD-IA family hydrolase [Nonomuraea sp. NPDC059023]|uniref:HAD-IA family hydrolase n=1 Tax=unclassified Nonomuraea TaxID=2593643 RepID=UPI0036C307E9
MRTSFSAIALDLDGTLVDSYADAEACWGTWAASKGIAAAFDLAQHYGRRRTDIVRSLLPHLGEPEIAAEAEAVRLAERDRTGSTVALPGVAALLEALPDDRWAIVTSNDTEVAMARLRGAGLPVPRVLVSADDVRHAKPHPEGFLLAAGLLGVDPADALAVDDSPSGIRAARAAGMTTIAVMFRHDGAALAEADRIAEHLGRIELEINDHSLVLRTPGADRGTPYGAQHSRG